jgi:hypothetical protein
LPGGQLPVTLFEIESLCKAVMLSPHDRYEMQIYWEASRIIFPRSHGETKVTAEIGLALVNGHWVPHSLDHGSRYFAPK